MKRFIGYVFTTILCIYVVLFTDEVLKEPRFKRFCLLCVFFFDVYLNMEGEFYVDLYVYQDSYLFDIHPDDTDYLFCFSDHSNGGGDGSSNKGGNDQPFYTCHRCGWIGDNPPPRISKRYIRCYKRYGYREWLWFGSI
jgi:hypothetical protein